ncbi:MAG: 23S rRNA (adenine(2503)-C(2))-methyltransferase RlmN [Gemmatimonadota bacterium]
MSDRVDLLNEIPPRVAELLSEHFTQHGVPSYRVKQALVWIYEKDARGFQEMTDLPVRVRAGLEQALDFTNPQVVRVEQSQDGTVKHLWRLHDGELIESVLIPVTRARASAPERSRQEAARPDSRAGAKDRLTLCISSQAGCAMACTFCATGWSGYRRNLTPAEIVAQFRGARRWARENERGPITNIVYMGMGEPLMNRKAVMRSLTLLNRAYGLGARRITVSTVGVVPGILEMAERKEQFRLAVSLHAPNHELREQIVPIEKKYPLPELLNALRQFDEAGGRRITFEYVMIDGVTDTLELAQQLADIVKPFGAHVNLIPYNPIPGPDWKTSTREQIHRFMETLEARGVRTSIRGPRGKDIAAACGQLRAEHAMAAPKPYLKFVELTHRKAS